MSAMLKFCIETAVYSNKTAEVYSQTCVKQAPLGKPKSGCLRQVLAKYRLIYTTFLFMGYEKLAF